MSEKDFIDSLITQAKAYKIPMRKTHANKLYVYYKELFTWNKSINLISKKEQEKFITRHIIDSIFPLNRLNFRKNDRILDIGSGNGLPAIPLSIMIPHISIDLVESNGKKCVFLRHIKAIIKAKNTKILQTRFEDLYHKSTKKYNYITVRGKKLTKKSIALTKKCLRKGGYLIIYGGRKAEKPFAKSGETFICFHSISNRTILMIPTDKK